MAYISTAEVTDMRARLKAAFPVADGWKFSLTKEHHSGVNFRFMEGPHIFTDYDRDAAGLQHVSNACAARICTEGNHFKAVTYAGVNHFHIAEAWPPESAAILQKASDIIHRDHWDESDMQSDYHHCAFYVSLGIGRWDKPYNALPARSKEGVQ